MNFYTNTTKNAVIPPNFQVWKFCVERHIFRIVSGELPETMRKMCLSTQNFHIRKLDEITLFFAVQFEFESKFKSRL